MLRNTLINALREMWPLLLILFVILTSVRISYLIYNRKKIIFYKEIFMFIFIAYILFLFYVVTFQESKISTSNFFLFKEILRYKFGSSLFIKNILGNILLFIPMGLFISYYINKRKLIPVIIITFISSLSIEFIQGKIGRIFDVDDILLNMIGGILGYLLYMLLDNIGDHLPRFLRNDWFKNIVIIIILVLLILYFFNFNTAFIWRFV